MKRPLFFALAAASLAGIAIFGSIHTADASAPNSYVRLQPGSPGTAQTGNGNLSGTMISGQFAGGGAGLTGLNATNITSGTLADARHSANVALLGGSQTFSGAKNFNAGISTSSFTMSAGSSEGEVLKCDFLGVGTWQPDGIDLPASASLLGTSTGFQLTHTGTGDLAKFIISNATSAGESVEATTTGSGNVFQGITTGTGRAAYFQVNNSANSSSTISAVSNGPGEVIVGQTTNSSTGAVGVTGLSVNGYGVVGTVGNASGWAVWAEGRSGASGTKSFRIDHPADPENKYLLHYSHEGSEPQNVYNGIVTTDARGRAWVNLPEYFAEINKNPRYQLTVIDDNEGPGFVQVKVARRILGNRFMIMTSAPNIEVSWEVKARRNDLWVRKYGAPVEETKPQSEQGKYQHPELYGMPKEGGMHHRRDKEADFRSVTMR